MLKYQMMVPLVSLGLSPDEAKCYEALLGGALAASDLAKRIGVLPNAVYRLIDKLRAKGFVVELTTRPAKFQAIPPSVAVEAYAKSKIKSFEELKTEAISGLTTPSGGQTKIDILTGKNAMFAKAAELVEMAKKEVIIISIGEPVPDEIKLANRDAVERGVEVKMIAHKYDKDNQQILKTWVRMGFEVRYFKDWGYHMIITDGKVALLATNNPQNTEERTALVIHSEGLANALRNYFYSLWEKALPIN